MAYGLLINNEDGVTVLNTTSMVLNAETVSVTQATVAGNSSTNVTVPDIHVPTAVIAEISGTGAGDIDTSTSTDTLTLTNTSNVQRTVDLEFWRLA